MITGITGQDGSFLAEFLIDKGYEVHGILRRSSSFNTGRIEHLYLDEWHESAEVSRQLAVILKRHHGQIPVFLHMERIRKKITMNEQFANDGSVASENALKLLLGNGAVEYDKEND